MVSLRGDEYWLREAVGNIVKNCMEHTPAGGEICIRAAENHLYTEITVSDNGAGIDKEDLPHIFERFYRVDKSHSREIGGTGLGLAITRNAVLMHRGAIKVFSTEGEGTIFNVRIPLNYIA